MAYTYTMIHGLPDGSGVQQWLARSRDHLPPPAYRPLCAAAAPGLKLIDSLSLIGGLAGLGQQEVSLLYGRHGRSDKTF